MLSASLVAAGLLAPSEAERLIGELARLKTEIYRNPPTDLRDSCYLMPFLPPAIDSTTRLVRRLPVLSELVNPEN